MIPHFLALDVGVKISQAQLCTSIRGCHATFLVKNTLFKGEVAWLPLREMQSCSSSILEPPTWAFKWGMVCLSTIITFEEKRSYVKKCWFYIVKIDMGVWSIMVQSVLIYDYVIATHQMTPNSREPAAMDSENL